VAVVGIVTVIGVLLVLGFAVAWIMRRLRGRNPIGAARPARGQNCNR
jgi:hypothetical protein